MDIVVQVAMKVIFNAGAFAYTPQEFLKNGKLLCFFLRGTTIESLSELGCS